MKTCKQICKWTELNHKNERKAANKWTHKSWASYIMKVLSAKSTLITLSTFAVYFQTSVSKLKVHGFRYSGTNNKYIFVIKCQ